MNETEATTIVYSLDGAAAVIALYFWGARQLGKRCPKAEKWPLGASAVPTYTAKHTT